MTLQHADIFHCLRCGRVIYERHGTVARTCCAQPMVRAVSDVVKDVPSTPFDDAQRQPDGQPDGQENALLAEAVEIGNWCRNIEDIDVSRYEQLGERMRGLHAALVDRFDMMEREFASAAEHERADAGRLRQKHVEILLELDCFVADLQRGEASFRGWAEVCERLDSIVADFWQNEVDQSALVRTVRGHA